MNHATTATYAPSRRNVRRIDAIACYTVLEAWRNRLIVLVVIAVALLTLLSLFARELAVTESTRLQTAILASTLRVASVFLIALYILNGLTREFNDKIIELMLSLDLPRPGYLMGKFLGFAMLALAVATIATVPVAILAPAHAALAWGCSLALELLIITALSVFCMTTFTQLLPAAAFVTAFYLLARSITAIQLMSGSGLLGVDGFGQKASAVLADALAIALPRMDAFTQTAWLVNDAGAQIPLLNIVLQTAVYVGLLLAAAMFDLYRKNF
ncbi:MAG TPA: ABC transporter permease [Burkholderiales bacterium]|jgi:ABC-type transport system involved in multi-copper enzyme maturation permease subunit|nr:ABC transporter permease [Burkholderiales bacterium]